MNIRTLLHQGRPRLALLCLLVAISVSVATARQLAPVSTSPATGHAQVVTQGIAKFTNQEMVWRVVQRTAPPRWEAKATRSVLGFVLASDEPVLLTNIVEENKKQDVARLGVGEVSLVQGGTKQIRASMGDHPVVYLSLEIVKASDAAKVGNGTVLFTSDPFVPPAGQRDVDLVRNVLRLRETATIPDTGQTVYILATDGAIDILPATGEEATTLQPGQSGIFSGPLEIEAVQPSAEGAGQIAAVGLTSALLQDADTSSAYVVAVIGDEIPPVPTRTPTPTEIATSSPTEIPTDEPATEVPNDEPTSEPTDQPTTEPTSTNIPPLDSDGDGVADSDERKFGSDPNNPDSDSDGLKDGAEVFTYGTSPTDRDTDNDALTDGQEINTYGTDPLDQDTDGDRLTDGREVAAGRDPLDPKN